MPLTFHVAIFMTRCGAAASALLFTVWGALPPRPPYAIARGGPVPHSAPAARSLRSLAASAPLLRHLGRSGDASRSLYREPPTMLQRRGGWEGSEECDRSAVSGRTFPV